MFKEREKGVVKSIKRTETTYQGEYFLQTVTKNGFLYCDGESHYLCGWYEWEKKHSNSHQECKNWEGITPSLLLKEGQVISQRPFTETFLNRFVPMLRSDEIWVRSYNRATAQEDARLERLSQIKYGGQEIPDDFLSGIILAPGEEAIVTGWSPVIGKGRDEKTKVLVRNENGILTEDWETAQKAAGRNFAQAAAAKIAKKSGLAEKAWMIVREAGPGAAVKSVEYGEKLLSDGYDPDTLLVVFNQRGPAETQLGWQRAREVLLKLNIKPPEARNSREFFRILQGARKFVHLVGTKE